MVHRPQPMDRNIRLQVPRTRSPIRQPVTRLRAIRTEDSPIHTARPALQGRRARWAVWARCLVRCLAAEERPRRGPIHRVVIRRPDIRTRQSARRTPPPALVDRWAVWDRCSVLCLGGELLPDEVRLI